MIIDKLKEIIESLDGSLLGIGLKEEILVNSIAENDSIKVCNLLESFFSEEDGIGKQKKVKVKNLRKKFKKNKTDFIIYNIETVEKYKDKFVYDSIYIGKKKIYAYSKEDNIDSIIKKYQRYSLINKIECKDGVVYEINLQRKLKKYDQFIYEFIDFISEIIILIGNILS